METPQPPVPGKERVSRKSADFRREPDALRESGFIFEARPELKRVLLHPTDDMSLFDKFGRQITDLRISVTDRCNFRCVYCRSADPENYREHDKILSWPELERLARIFIGLGIRKVRLTGGEPLGRPGVEQYIA